MSLKQRIIGGVALAAVASLPFFGSNYALDVANRCGIAVIAVLGLNILTGFTGLISLGNAAFMAIGGFSAAFLAARAGVNGFAAIPAAGAIAALLGMVVGIPSLRLKGLYLAMATLAAHFIVEFTVVKWESVTGGVSGLSVPAPALLGIALDDDRKLFGLVLALALAALLFARNLFRSRPGRAFIAVRDHETAAAVMGVDVFRAKITAFGLSAFFVGVAGALSAFQSRIISPESYPLSLAIDALSMVIIGGMGSVAGSVLGAVGLTLLPEGLRAGATALSSQWPDLIARLSSLKELVFSVLIIVFLIFEPHGLAATWRRVVRSRQAIPPQGEGEGK
jgi:branched-chain amino acid transport system permease protein